MDIKEWGIAVCTASLLCAVMLAAGSGEKMATMIKVISAAAFLTVLLAPLASLPEKAALMGDKLEAYSHEWERAQLENVRILDVAKETLDKELLRRLSAEHGVTEVRTSLSFQGEGVSVDRVTLVTTGGSTEQEKSQLTELVSALTGCNSVVIERGNA